MTFLIINVNIVNIFVIFKIKCYSKNLFNATKKKHIVVKIVNVKLRKKNDELPHN